MAHGEKMLSISKDCIVNIDDITYIRFFKSEDSIVGGPETEIEIGIRNLETPLLLSGPNAETTQTYLDSWFDEINQRDIQLRAENAYARNPLNWMSDPNGIEPEENTAEDNEE